MEDPITARRLSPADAESFFAEGVDARTAAPGPEPGISYTHARTFPKCECGGITVPNGSGDITRLCIRCGAIVRSVVTLIEQPERSFERSDWVAAAHQPDEEVQGSPTRPGGTGAAGPSQPPAGEAAGGPENQRHAEPAPAASRHTEIGTGREHEGAIEDCMACGPILLRRAAVTQADGFAADSDLRCTDCRRLRHATPRHSPDCRYAWQNCPGCADASSGHIASCPIAAQLKLPTDVCCDGVDLPSIGHVHSPTCQNLRPVVRASHTLASLADGETKRLDDCRGLWGQLLFASRDLAMYRVMAPIASTKGFCTECGGSVGREFAEHTGTCRTGRVLDLVAKICAASPAAAAEGGAR